MTRILIPHLTHPIEREYESWILASIERYFWSIGRQVQMWAVSPSDEKSWPADDAFVLDGKLIGIQFKQTKLGQVPKGQPPDYSRVHWYLGQPAGQYALVSAVKEIFYCFPTFISRQWRHNALDHCLFWKPSGAKNYNVWYDNPKAQTPYNQLVLDPKCWRWGALYERIVSCELGRVIEGRFSVRDYVQGLQRVIQETPIESADETTEGGALYLVHIPLP